MLSLRFRQEGKHPEWREHRWAEGTSRSTDPTIDSQTTRLPHPRPLASSKP